MLARAGVCHWRLHGSARRPDRLRCAAGRLLPSGPAAVFGPSRNRVRPCVAAAIAPAACAARDGHLPVRKRRAAASRRPLGEADTRCSNQVHRVDARRQTAAPAVPRSAGRQKTGRRRERGLKVAGGGELVRDSPHGVRVTRPAKTLFPQDKITKGDLIEYYRRIAPWILPHLRGRPLAMERYPDGVGKPGFFQKTASFYYPSWIETVTIKKKLGGTVKHVICNDTATLVYLANQACVTPHVWLSRSDKLDYPDQMVFDLDPAADD